MPTEVKWETAAPVEVFPGTDNASDADIRDLLTTEGAITAAVNNVDGNQYIKFVLEMIFDVAPAATEYISLWLIQSVDGGTVYERGSVSSRAVTAPARPADVVFPLANVTSQIVASALLLAPPCHFKILLVNDSAQDFNDTSGNNTLTYVFANDESQ